MESSPRLVFCGSSNDSSSIETVPTSPVIKKRRHSDSIVPEDSERCEDILEEAPCEIREKDVSQDNTLSKQARDLLLDYVKDHLLWQRVKQLILRDIISYSMSIGEYYKQTSVMTELTKLLANNDSGPFYKELRTAMIQVEELSQLSPSLIRPQVNVEIKITPKEEKSDAIRKITLNPKIKTDFVSKTPTPSFPVKSIILNRPISSNASSPAIIARKSEESLYDKLEKVKDDVFALSWAHSRPEETKKMISSCGKILVSAVFSDKEILEGNPTGRKKINCDKPIQKYDSKKIVFIAKFLGWIQSQPTDRSIENFKKWESSTKGTGLSGFDYRLFWDNVMVKYTSDLRKRIEQSKIN